MVGPRQQIPIEKIAVLPLTKVLRSSYSWWISGVVLSLILAVGYLYGWGLSAYREVLSTPLTYNGDGLAVSWTIQRIIEGWVFDNPRSGYPFGSNFLDYPGSELGNYLALKALSIFSNNYVVVLNLFVLLSFPVVFIVAFGVLLSLRMFMPIAFAAALLYSFIPFHFLRIGHLFYLWYFVVPLFFYFGFKIFNEGVVLKYSNNAFTGVATLMAIAFLLASFGVYYALFGVIVLAACALSVTLETGSFRSAKASAVIILFVIAGVFLNVAPNIVNNYTNGKNIEVAVRDSSEAEVYGLKFMQLVLPRPGHRTPQLAHLTQHYNETYPLVNENSTSSLGVVGGAGFAGLLMVLLASLSHRKIDQRLSFLALIVFVLFLFGTIGGLGSLFSAAISASIRGWNRISVFIAFGAIAAFFIALQIFIEKYFSAGRAKTVLMGCALVFGGVGLYDQTVPACIPCNEQTKAAFENDRNFVVEIEKSLPSGSAVYQLPYMPFPEVAPLHRLHTYDLSIAFLHSIKLHWSYAGMKGREGDRFYRALAQESIEKQIEVIGRMGFSGIYIDRRGFEDNADRLIDRLSTLLGSGPLLKRADGQVVFFRLPSSTNVDLSGMGSFEIMKRAGYVVDKLGARHPASFSDGIDFKRRTWPEFVRNVKGISGPEPWGRWSDTSLGQGVRFDFFSPLPDRFTLVLSAQPFGRNGEQTIVIKVGDQTRRLTLPPGESEIRLPIVLNSGRVDTIEFIPQDPISPKELRLSDDIRKLGIGFVRLLFEK